MILSWLVGLSAASGVLYDAQSYGRLLSVDLDVQVDGRIATGTAEYVFDPVVEGLHFATALPEGAAVVDLQARLDGDWVQATAEPAITAQPGPDGSLDDLLAGDVFTVALPGGSLEPVEILISWQIVLRAEDGAVALQIPMSDGGLNPSDPQVRWTGDVVGHGVLSTVSATPGTATLTDGVGRIFGALPLSALDTLVLGWTEPAALFGLEVRTYRPSFDPFTGEGDPDGYALVTVLPGPPDPGARVDALYTFVLDSSASMQGRPMHTAVAANAAWLRKLKPTDRFNLIPYTSVAVPFRGRAPEATDGAVDRAIAFLERQSPAGLSDPTDGLVTGLALLDDTVQNRSFFSCGGTTGAAQGPPERGAEIGPARGEPVVVAPYVVWITDGGASTGDTDHDTISNAILDANSLGASVFAVGVGGGVDRALLERIAGEHRGEVRYADRVGDVAEVVAGLRDRIANPVLVHPSADVADTTLQAPAALPDVAVGTEMVFAFRYTEPGQTTLRLRGLRGQEEYSERFALVLPGFGNETPAVARVWAQLRARDLDRQVLAGNDAAYTELERLVRNYGVSSDAVTLGFTGALDEYGYSPSADMASMGAASKDGAGCGCATPRGLAGGFPMLMLLVLASRRR